MRDFFFIWGVGGGWLATLTIIFVLFSFLRVKSRMLTEVCIKLIYFFVMKDDDAVNAEAFINKASFLVSSSQNEVLNLQYKVDTLLFSEGYRVLS